MTEDMAEMAIEDTQPRRARVVEDRARQLGAELEVSGRFNTALAQAAGLGAVSVPDELLREMAEVRARMREAGPLSLADFPEELRRESQSETR